jgi:hypothetical protein
MTQVTLESLCDDWRKARNSYFGVTESEYEERFGHVDKTAWFATPENTLRALANLIRVQLYQYDKDWNEDEPVEIQHSHEEADRAAMIYMLALKRGLEAAMLWKLGAQEWRWIDLQDLLQNQPVEL